MPTTLLQHSIKLAVNIISSYFGDIVAIIQFTVLTKQNVVNSLLVLIQHNCVQTFVTLTVGKFGGAPGILTQYMALFDNIIHHLRFPKFIAIVNVDLGKEEVLSKYAKLKDIASSIPVCLDYVQQPKDLETSFIVSTSFEVIVAT
ncbi:DNA-directed RNA polymerase III subunit RPC3 [Heracleum sosnowskyi]|uniref:DNA-directed RNA polymerase III subunit RPC3 n=1 Tax=Heracleum sosnowskyi TaxID=360622 RepID=A0AAD8IPY8_9APIA|nr:DNA-directed RNA polymerase III subunit RPC3 [Heracleum sosnowskyi]